MPVRVIILARHIFLLKLGTVLLHISSGSWLTHQGTPLLDTLTALLSQLGVQV